MLRTSALLSTVVGAIAMTAVAAEAAPAGSKATDFSAQQNQQNQNVRRGGGGGGNVNRGGGGGNINRNVNVNRGGGGGSGNVNAIRGGGGNVNRNVNVNRGGGGGGNVNAIRGGGGNVNQNVNVNRGGGGTVNVNRGGGGGGNVNRNVNVNRGGGGGGNVNAIRGGGGNVNQNVNVNRGGGNVNRNVNVNPSGGGGNINRNVNVNRGGNINRGGNVNIQNGTLQRAGMPVQRQGGSNLRTGPGRVVTTNTRFVHKGPTVVVAGNRVVPVWRGDRRRIWWRGSGWRTFVPVTALAVVAVGGAYLYADSYLAVSRPYCEGVTPDGCTLNWRRVDFAEGDSDWQCVRYCPRPGAMPPPRAVALVAPPPPPQQGGCEITIYPEPDFGGTGVTTNEEQPQLSASGWQNQIASIEVKSGLWDLFSDEEFTGETLRLEPGSYPDLGPEWTRKSGSLMCVDP